MNTPPQNAYQYGYRQGYKGDYPSGHEWFKGFPDNQSAWVEGYFDGKGDSLEDLQVYRATVRESVNRTLNRIRPATYGDGGEYSEGDLRRRGMIGAERSTVDEIMDLIGL